MCLPLLVTGKTARRVVLLLHWEATISQAGPCCVLFLDLGRYLRNEDELSLNTLSLQGRFMLILSCCLRTNEICLWISQTNCTWPACPPPFYYHRKRPPIKSKKSPVGSWRSFFNLGKSSSMSKRKLHRNPSEPNELKAMALAGESDIHLALE